MATILPDIADAQTAALLTVEARQKLCSKEIVLVCDAINAATLQGALAVRVDLAKDTDLEVMSMVRDLLVLKGYSVDIVHRTGKKLIISWSHHWPDAS